MFIGKIKNSEFNYFIYLSLSLLIDTPLSKIPNILLNFPNIYQIEIILNGYLDNRVFVKLFIHKELVSILFILLLGGKK